MAKIVIEIDCGKEKCLDDGYRCCRFMQRITCDGVPGIVCSAFSNTKLKGEYRRIRATNYFDGCRLPECIAAEVKE